MRARERARRLPGLGPGRALGLLLALAGCRTLVDPGVGQPQAQVEQVALGFSAEGDGELRVVVRLPPEAALPQASGLASFSLYLRGRLYASGTRALVEPAVGRELALRFPLHALRSSLGTGRERVRGGVKGTLELGGGTPLGFEGPFELDVDHAPQPEVHEEE